MSNEQTAVNDEFDYVTRKELVSVCEDISKSMTEMKDVINVQAEVLGMCRYLLAAFMPPAQFADAVAKFRAVREKQIEEADGSASDTNQLDS